MKYERLEEMTKKQKLFEKLTFLFFIPAMLVLLSIMLWIANNEFNFLLVSIGIGIGMLFLAGTAIFIAKEGRYSNLKDEHIIGEISKLIEASGVPADSYELISVERLGYKVAFHNVFIDYDVLQAKIDEELSKMNKIADMNIKIKLI